MKVLKSLKSISRYYKEDKGKIIILSIAILVLNIEGLLFSALWAFILQSIMDQNFFETLMLVILYAVFYFADLGLDSLITYLQTKMSSKFLKKDSSRFI